jgi:uncharacterized protein YjbI with pentapeptide repeats
MEDANLEGSNCAGAMFYRANLNGSCLVNTNFTNSDLSNADLRGADVTGAVFMGANLTGVVLTSEQSASGRFRGSLGLRKSAPRRKKNP